MQEGGRIVHITSIHGERVEPGFSSYAVAKAALNQYCLALALELAPRGILVNAIAPGFVDTPMSIVNGANELETERFRQNYVEGHHLPLRRAAQPEETAGAPSDWGERNVGHGPKGGGGMSAFPAQGDHAFPLQEQAAGLRA